ncbi:glycine dehydrogenase (decarboxylating), mitochondrial [Patella vulgata]|uniref:glycine dehydrogenase (decarboxylating), mitochondrial n=1 Tax=Patella vulgata TaxID=6465 RepID=UPI0024A93268|nr:glycine dehydrogenase (decarboxylating), mitochondrial [Patella vulgata]
MKRASNHILSKITRLSFSAVHLPICQPINLPKPRFLSSNHNALQTIFSKHDTFQERHIGPSQLEKKSMLEFLGLKDITELVNKAVPADILLDRNLDIEEPLGEHQLIQYLKQLSNKNQIWRSYIGMGYHNTYVPHTIMRNIFENPGWVTQYTPYQAELAQGRLESLLNYQTMMCDLTGLDISNASLLDEATAAAEAMGLCFRHSKRRRFYVDSNCHPQNIAVVKTRADALGIEVVICDWKQMEFDTHDFCGVLLQYPNTEGNILDYSLLIESAHTHGTLVVAATDPLALAIMKPPGEIGFDIALGTTQRFGIPLGYGGPHAAFFACKNKFLRLMPGRMIGVTKDANGNEALRLALQTREQHIRRDKATSNICTAQALLANMSAMFACYHGPEGLRHIADRIHNATRILAEGVRNAGHTVINEMFFDTITFLPVNGKDEIINRSDSKKVNLRQFSNGYMGISLDETTEEIDLKDLLEIVGSPKTAVS